MADDLTANDSVAQPESLVQPAAAAAEAIPPDHPAPLYGKRFALAYALLAVVLGTAAGFAVVLFGSDDGSKGAAWSEWKPSSEGTTPQLKEITSFVAPKYRLDSGRQLVAVDVGPLTVQAQDQAVSVTDIAVRSGSADGDVINVESGDNAFMFNMCGLGERCSINEGKASTERHLLLRRQALELALYSFRYVGSVKSVVTFLPPPPTSDGSPTVLYLRRQDLESQLDSPLRRSLLPLSRLAPADVPPTETALIDQLTKPRLFTFDFQQSPTGGAVMILDPAI